jgi:hypothetical protein
MSVNPNSKNIYLKFEKFKRNSSNRQYKNISYKKSISIDENKEEISHELLSKILDTINSNSLNIFYPDSNNDFKKQIDSLNLKFYLETEKYLANKNKYEKCQTSLFIILFKQINVYIKEIERLNLIIVNKKFDPQHIMERTDEIIKKQNELLIKEELIKTLKESNSNIESKYLESKINENKLKKEIQALKKENYIIKKEILLKPKLTYNKKKINKAYLKKEISENILQKSTRSNFHSSTIKDLIYDGAELYSSIGKHNNFSYKNENGAYLKKRNSSDNKKIILNNSFVKLNKINGADFNANKGRKLLLQKYQKRKDKANILNISNNNAGNNTNRNMLKKNIVNSSRSNCLNNKVTISFRLNNKVDNNNYNINNYKVNYSQGKNTPDSKSSNLDYSTIKPIKTEYIISDLEEYKKGFIYENNMDNKKNKEKQDIKVTFCYSKSRDKKYSNLSGKIKNKNSNDNTSSVLVSNNLNERKNK